MESITSLNYVDMENEPKPNLCQMFQPDLMINGKYNNSSIILIRVLIFAHIGPLYALVYSFPASIIIAIMFSLDNICCIFDVETLSVPLQLLSIPIRVLQALVFTFAVLIFNVSFWLIMLIPIYLLCLCWAFRMIFYWSILDNKKAKVMRKRISALYS
jgi:hypothetical protein